MNEFFRKHKTIITRTVGILMLVGGFVAYNWSMPKKGFSENEAAKANLARIEASVKGVSSSQSRQSNQENRSPFFEKYKSTQEKQMRYFLIILMIGGAIFLVYSLVSKKSDE